LRDLGVVAAAYLLLPHARQVHTDGEHIGIGGHSRGPHGFRPLEVGRRRANRLSRHLQALLAQQDAFIGAHHPGDQIHAGSPLLLTRHLPAELGRPNLLGGQPRVPNRLVQHHLRLEVVHGIGTIERANGEILLAELVLRQQRAEHEDRIVAALPGFGVVQLRQVSAAS